MIEVIQRGLTSLRRIEVLIQWRRIFHNPTNPIYSFEAKVVSSRLDCPTREDYSLHVELWL
jgi:hypothetical protein